MLETVCSRFDLPWHGRLAAAYVQTRKDIFLRTKIATPCRLLQKQVAHGHGCGFVEKWEAKNRTSQSKSSVLTGIALFLKIMAGQVSLDEEVDVIRKHWFSTMHIALSA